jgi:hypothetical protein
LARIMGSSVRVIERHYGALLSGANAGIVGQLDALDAERDTTNRCRDECVKDVRTGPYDSPTMDFIHALTASLLKTLTAQTGLLLRVVASLAGITTIVGAWPGGPDSAFAVVSTATNAVGINADGPVSTVQGWLQDPARADVGSQILWMLVVVGALSGVAQAYRSGHDFAAPSVVLLSALAIGASATIPWGWVALAVLFGVYKWRAGDGDALGIFATEVAVAVLYAPLAVMGLLFWERTSVPQAPPA